MWLKQYFNDRYNRIEVLFFLIYYFLFPILSGLEYNLVERGQISLIWNEMPSRITSFIFAVPPAWLCYKILIQRYLFQKKYTKFISGYLLYLILLNFYTLYKYLLLSKLTFLSERITNEALKYYEANTLVHFSTVYMLRELLVLTALAYFIRSAKLDTQLNLLSKQQIKAELNYLKTQIQPHFFFNTLNNIYALTLQRSEQAAPLVARHSEIMRYILYTSVAPTVPLRQEIAFLENYVAVEAVRYADKIAINFETQGITDDVQIAPLLLLPFVENTFKHGINEEINEGFVLIIISLMNNELSVEISNSKSTDKKNAHGFGLNNARKRLDMLYKDQYTLHISDKVTYTVSLTIKLQRK